MVNSGFNIITSNRLELLARQLARNVRTPLTSPFDPEIIVIQSKGMERWISMELARFNGVCANCSFPFPNAFLDEMFRKMVPDLPKISIFDPRILAFKIMELLPDCIKHPQFKSLETYLEDDTHQFKLYQLSEKIAYTFDQYLIFRTQMVFEWEAGKENHWQAILWRKLFADAEKPHRARLSKELTEWIGNESAVRRFLPERISIFGISYLPQFHVAVFSEISRLVPVYLYLMNPCQEYWADILSDREIKQIKGNYRHTHPDVNAEDLHLEMGNRLLASMGSLGRDFFRRISANGFDTQELLQDPGCDGLLACIQSDIMNLRERTPLHSNVDDEPNPDRSIQVHSCHSPMREVEVLFDNLLDMFESDPQLLPKDIIIMTPDIEPYAPFIRSVFDVQDDPGLRIPFSIADQSLKKESRFIDAFLSILGLKDSRLGAAKVFSVLEFPAIREQFGLSEIEMEKIEHWIKDTNIRWGRDIASRSKFGIGDFSENTWQAGLDRLLLGYALPGGEQNVFNGILPYDHIEGSDSIVLGKFIEFMTRLFACIDSLEQYRTLDNWSIILNNILEQFFVSDEMIEPDIQMLRRILGELPEAEALSGLRQKVSFQVVRFYVDHRLKSEKFGFGFISGGVTFCAMLPMRSIPFKVVCLIGMNSDTFPRESQSLGFDFIAKHPKPGDRSRRNDDKYLFLEALISARERLYISYTGQSIQDNTLMPPSVLVSELLDYIKSGFGLSEDQIVIHHPLQAFSPKYFKADKTLFSYSEENLLAAVSLRDSIQMPQNPAPFISGRLPLSTEELKEWKKIDIDDLCAFFGNPAQYMLQRRFDIYLDEEQILPEESENFIYDPLEKFLIGQALVGKRRSGSDLQALRSAYRAQGRLPVGSVGRVFYNQLSSDADVYAKKIECYTNGHPRPPLVIDVDIDGFHIQGRLNGVYDNGLFLFRHTLIKSKYLLYTWIYHILFNVINEENNACKSLLLGQDAAWEFSPAPDSIQFLKDMLKLYGEGITKPLHFFPESSFAYARQIFQVGNSKQAALKAAEKKWRASDFFRAESQDPYYDLCFGRCDPIDQSFQESAETVFRPIFHHGSQVI